MIEFIHHRINLSYTDNIRYQHWKNDNYTKFEFEIQLLHICHESNGDSIYTVNAYKIYSKYSFASLLFNN